MALPLKYSFWYLFLDQPLVITNFYMTGISIASQKFLQHGEGKIVKQSRFETIEKFEILGKL